MTLPFLQFDSVSKNFNGNSANTRVSFEVQQGSFHGIVGENGAGKSTIMKILYGVHSPDSGTILLNGISTQFNNPNQAIRAGIGMVHQHFKLVPTLSVWENIILGHEPTSLFIPKTNLLATIQQLQNDFGFSLDLEEKVETLPVGQQQQVEILKLLFRKARILILDEPTAVLTPQESEVLLNRLLQLKKQQKTIILITHKLREILEFTDTVTIMRQGKVVATESTASLDEHKLATLMMGRDRQVPVTSQRSFEPQTAVLEVSSLSTKSRKGLQLRNLSLNVAAGEIVGIAGIEGQGQEELVQVLTQLKSFSGHIKMLGEDLLNFTAYQNRQRGFGVIPPDRQKNGLILPFTNEYNLILGHHWEKPFQGLGCLSFPDIRQFAQDQLKHFDVRPCHPDLPTATLSGGNQQKIIIAREASDRVRFLLACHPSRGVDIGAMEFFHEHFRKLRAEGAGILLISSDLDELRTLSDRILVIRNGAFIAEKAASNWTLPDLGLCMTGTES